ncbi:hypothetical protein GCM10012275_47470 [Longimycelium tulufanense]|uniref:Sec-independent protein translocase protein TatA n=1 Tax=Longimycelium tulufanense TaxID=907463 RepID=A0A8J3CHT9_9PSEU|nr:Sec-independent protein translocase subunit TatA [Longimycelium tulufanense]GGM71508.1 hypothetical protein GCM10012275_47470 [Longimycelium tulufanense]
MSLPGGWELLLLLGVLVLLFGAKKLPDTARAIGKSMRIFKAETKGMRQDEAAESAAEQAQQQPAPQQLPPAQQTPPAANPAQPQHNARPDVQR